MRHRVRISRVCRSGTHMFTVLYTAYGCLCVETRTAACRTLCPGQPVVHRNLCPDAVRSTRYSVSGCSGQDYLCLQNCKHKRGISPFSLFTSHIHSNVLHAHFRKSYTIIPTFLIVVNFILNEKSTKYETITACSALFLRSAPISSHE